MNFDLRFYKGKKVFVTGHTGFKGSWLCKILNMLGAEVMGFALEPNEQNSIFDILSMKKDIYSVIGDIRDFEIVKRNILNFQPEIVFHLAAQPLVIESYKNPVYTFNTNIIGTANILEASAKTGSVRAVV